METDRRRAWLAWPDGALPLEPGREVRIGRCPTNDVALADEREASRQHAKLVWPPDSALPLLIDLQSTNGTWIEGRRVGSAFLDGGATFQIGRCRLEVRFDEPTPRRPSARAPRIADQRVVLLIPRSRPTPAAVPRR